MIVAAAVMVMFGSVFVGNSSEVAAVVVVDCHS